MKKADLKTGMIVTVKNGYQYLLVEKCFVGLTNASGWTLVENFTDNLYNRFNDDYDIIRVDELRDLTTIRNVFKFGLREDNISNIWTRPTKKKYTYSQLKEILGEEFEIVKD
jgi:hypothetical protein